MIPGTDTETFKEVNMNIRVVLALRAERANKKVYFIIFTERVADCVIANLQKRRRHKDRPTEAPRYESWFQDQTQSQNQIVDI